MAISYQDAYLDPRVILMVLYSVVIVLGVTRSRLSVVDGQLTRRLLVGERRVRLNSLAGVQIRRGRYLKNEGVLPTNLVALVDQAGQRTTFKPVLWQKSAGPILATLSVCCRAQKLATDERTTGVLARANRSWAHEIPGWAYGTRTASYAPPPPLPRRAAVLVDRFLIRRDDSGRAKKLQWRMLLIPVVMLAVGLPPVWLASHLGTAAIRSARCGSASTLWTKAPDFPTETVPAQAVTYQAAALISGMGRPTLYGITSAGIANQYNTSAVQRDARQLVEGQDLRWQDGSKVLADLQVEEFSNHQAALAFQSDYAEDHCAEGDHVFATPSVPGGIGIRCQCTGTTVEDRIAFVRGSLRIQAIDWVVPSSQGHQAVTELAMTAVRATSQADPAS